MEAQAPTAQAMKKWEPSLTPSAYVVDCTFSNYIVTEPFCLLRLTNSSNFNFHFPQPDIR